VGSVVGSLFCAGVDIPDITALARNIGWRDIASLVWPRAGFLSFKRLEALLIRQMGDITFSDLTIPFAAVATDMVTGTEVVLCEGPLAPAVRASCSIPGVVEPCLLENRILADGGIINNVPVSVVRAMGADIAIAADVFAPSYVRGLGPFGKLITAVEILVARAGGGVTTADYLVRPALAGASYLLFTGRDRLIDLGREAAEAILPEIKAGLEA
jgi:NTE family protein